MDTDRPNVWTERTYAIYDAVTRKMYGLPYMCPEPSEPTPAESLLLRALESTSTCRAYDLIDEAMAGAVGETRDLAHTIDAHR